jgi:hypothetical protein
MMCDTCDYYVFGPSLGYQMMGKVQKPSDPDWYLLLNEEESLN